MSCHPSFHSFFSLSSLAATRFTSRARPVGMDSISPQCTPLKREYEECFTRWYQDKFLRGELGNDCKELFFKYKTCVEVGSEPTPRPCSRARQHTRTHPRGQQALRDKKLDRVLEESRKEHPFGARGDGEGAGEG